MYRHILFPHDGSERSCKVEADCIALAKAVGARLTVIQVVRVVDFVPAWDARLKAEWVRNQVDSMATGTAHDGLARFKTQAQTNGVECQVLVKMGGQPYKAIVRQARESGCDLIVMASHGHGSLRTLIQGSQTVKVLSHCAIPTLVLR